MNTLFAAAAFAAAQAAPAAPVDHSQHTLTQHAQHQQGLHESEHKCCKEVGGKMECQMKKDHRVQDQAPSGHVGH